LAIDLDVDEQLVHHRRRRLVLEALVRHDVAPVAGRIADRQQDRLGRRLGLRQRLRTPRSPMDGIVLVLQEIGARFEPAAVLAHGCSGFGGGRSRLRPYDYDSRPTVPRKRSVMGESQSAAPTIFALSTASGRAGVAVVRISGPAASAAIYRMA